MCDFSFNITESPAELVTKVTTLIAPYNGTLDTNTGQFSVKGISGSYTITGQQLNVHIDHKPLLIGCGLIESEIQSHLN